MILRKKLYDNGIKSLEDIDDRDQDDLIQIPYIGFGISEIIMEETEKLLNQNTQI